MTGIVAVNMKKFKMATSLNNLIGENYRTDENAAHYDNGKRCINTSKTKENYFLLERPADYDAHRQERIDRVNRERAKRIDVNARLKNNQKDLTEKELKASRNRELAKIRPLRSDTIDTFGIVVQPSSAYIKSMTREKQIEFFKDALEVMQARPDLYGRIETAVIHFDENTAHMQCLATTINEETLTSEASVIFGNRTKMSNRQTIFADDLKARGYDVVRGMKRVNNPDYKNFKDEMSRLGVEINRHNDTEFYKQWLEIQGVKEEQAKEQACLDMARSSLEAQIQAQNEKDRELVEKIENALKIENRASEKLKEADEKFKKASELLNSAVLVLEKVDEERERIGEKKMLLMRTDIKIKDESGRETTANVGSMKDLKHIMEDEGVTECNVATDLATQEIIPSRKMTKQEVDFLAKQEEENKDKVLEDFDTALKQLKQNLSTLTM